MAESAATESSEYMRAIGDAVWRERALRGTLTLRGGDAAEFLQGQLTNDVEALKPGTGCYALLLNPKGKVRADMRVLCPAQDELVIESSRPALDVVAQMIASHAVGFRFELADDRERSALISLIGPHADRLLASLGDTAPVPAHREHDNVRSTPAGVAALAVRTDLGVDLVVVGDADGLGDLRAALAAEAGDPAGADTVETLRVESGRPLLGREIDGDTIPQEAGLNERAVSFEKGCYVGQETVARLFYKGKPNRHLRGLRLNAPASSGAAVRLGGREVGRIGTFADSPRHGPIALAVLRREAKPGTKVTVGQAVDALVVKVPFVGD
jgi:folate-binding protein YgfZ